jgi:hypothetical protein
MAELPNSLLLAAARHGGQFNIGKINQTRWMFRQLGAFGFA